MELKICYFLTEYLQNLNSANNMIFKNFSMMAYKTNKIQGICKLDSGGRAVLEHCPHRTAPLRA